MSQRVAPRQDAASTRAEETLDFKPVADILARHNSERGALIGVLEEIQTQYGYLPESALRLAAEQKGLSLVDLYGLATFYRSFSLKPRGRRLVTVCLGTACHVRGGPTIAQELERQLSVPPGETTADGEFTLETVNCLGACALGPVVVIDGRYFSKVRRSKVRQLLEDSRSGVDSAGPGAEAPILLQASCPQCRRTLMDEQVVIDGHPSVCVDVSVNGQSGWLRLSSLYGSPGFSAEHDIAAGAVARFFCPHCDAEMLSAWSCPVCEAPMAEMLVDSGGVSRVCARRGCQSRMLDLC